MTTITRAARNILTGLCMATLTITLVPTSAWATSCTPHSYFIVSDTQTEIAPDTPAILTYDESPFWVDIAGAEWIWESYLVADPANESNVTFERDFFVEGDVSIAELAIAGDDYFAVYINGEEITREYDVLTIESNFTEVKRYPIDSDVFEVGKNTLTIDSTNAPYFYGSALATPYNNPAGVIFVLSIESESCANNLITDNGSGNTGGGNAPKDAQFVNAFSGGIGGNPEEPTNPTANFINALGESNYVYAHNDEGHHEVIIEEAVTEGSEFNPLLASALSALPNTDLACSIIALILVLLLYIAWLIVPSRRSKFDTSWDAKTIDIYKLTYFLGGLLLILIILYFLSLSCVVAPLLVMFALMMLGIYFKII